MARLSEQRSARVSDVILATGYWQTQSGPPTTAPGNGKYNADNWASPTMIAIAGIDNDGYSRQAGLLQLRPGDQIMQLGTNDSQNYQTWSVTSVTDQGTWVQIGVQVMGAGTAFVTPGMNQTRLIQALQVVAQETAPPASYFALPNLATPDDIISRMGRNLNQIEANRVDAMLADGSSIIRRYAQNDFTYVSQDVITIVADNGVIVLPGRPIHSVDGVIWKSGVSGIPDMPITWYIFDGINTVTIPDPGASGIINLPEYWYDVTYWYNDSFEITNTHGYQVVPADIKALLCSAIISELSTPTMSATIQSESIGAYSYSMRRGYGGAASGGAMAGIFAALRDFGMMELTKDFRIGQGTIAVRHLW